MYYDFRVKIPDEKGKIYTKTVKGVVYINYEYDRVYKPDKKYNIPKHTTIGKMCDDDPKMTAKEALELYKSRDASEKLFKTDKSFLGSITV